jgi:hypothetical protein
MIYNDHVIFQSFINLDCAFVIQYILWFFLYWSGEDTVARSVVYQQQLWLLRYRYSKEFQQLIIQVRKMIIIMGHKKT